MRNYKVYFELYGKKMRTRVMAESAEAAKKAIIEKIIFHKVEKEKEEFNEAMDILDHLNGVLKCKFCKGTGTINTILGKMKCLHCTGEFEK